MAKFLHAQIWVRVVVIVVVLVVTPIVPRARALQHVLPRELIEASINSSLENSSSDFDSSFRSINRRSLLNCFDLNPFVKITVDTAGPLRNVQEVTVNISGVTNPGDNDWLAVVSPADASTSNCPDVAVLYVATGDTSEQPLLCHYPVKFKYLSDDPGYLSCERSNCEQEGLFGSCVVESCSASITFRLINIRSDISFVLFTGGLQVPCVVGTAGPLAFRNPKAPLYGHLSSVDSTGTTMRITWTSGDPEPMIVQYGNGSTELSAVSTYTRSNMCEPSAAADLGWHDPGYIHTAIMKGLSPSSQFLYQYGSQTELSTSIFFTTPPAAGDNNVTFIIYGDMGKAERDGSSIHFIQPGSISVIDAVTAAVTGSNVDFVFHIGDISYATGFIVEWDNFLELIEPIASRVPYMTAIGNHERDHPFSGSYYSGTDSGGECGIPYYNYFQMPNQGADKPWYSLESGPVHFTIVSTEHDFKYGSDQYLWIQSDLASVDRARTPWVVFAGHRPMYTSLEDSFFNGIRPAVDTEYRDAIEPLLLAGKVDLSLAGHVHNYERLCAVYQGNCLLNHAKDAMGLDTYNFTTYAAPVQAVLGMSGYELDGFRSEVDVWSKVRITEFGYAGIQVTKSRLLLEFIYVNGTVGDTFQIVK